MEAGQLRKGDALLTLFETAAGAAAVACYPDEARDLESLIGEVLGAARMQIAPDARKLLVARLGADRALSRAEVEKPRFYARGKTRIEEADVEAAVGDAAETALDRVVMSAASGRPAEAVRECERCVTGGESAQGVIPALQRHFLRLHRLRSGPDAGGPLEDLIRALKPPPNFRRRLPSSSRRARGPWRRLNTALARIGDVAEAGASTARWRTRWRKPSHGPRRAGRQNRLKAEPTRAAVARSARERPTTRREATSWRAQRRPERPAGARIGCVGSHMSNQRRSQSAALRPDTEPMVNQPRRSSDHRRSVSASKPISRCSAAQGEDDRAGMDQARLSGSAIRIAATR